jgi:hypothetical protein
MKTFAWILVEIVGIPATVITILFLLGVKIDQRIIKAATEIAAQWGTLIVVVLLLMVGAETSHRVIKADREKYEKDFYGANSQARIERAHLIFFHLYQKGHQVKAGIPADRHEWDKEVQRTLREYCNEDCISTYLVNTERYNPGTDSHSIPEDKLNWALQFVWQLLLTNFENRFKT